MRGTGHIKDATTRNETRGFARAEFERHRGVTDLVRRKPDTEYPFHQLILDCSHIESHQISLVHWQDRVGDHGEVYWWNVDFGSVSGLVGASHAGEEYTTVTASSPSSCLSFAQRPMLLFSGACSCYCRMLFASSRAHLVRLP